MADEKKTEADKTTGGSTTTEPKRPASADQPKASASGTSKTASGTSKGVSALDRVRTLIGQVVWLICVACALLLAIGALTYALNANADNALVEFARDGANAVDLGVFSMENGIKEFVGKDSDVKNALVNWGIGAVAYLVIGRFLDRLIRP